MTPTPTPPEIYTKAEQAHALSREIAKAIRPPGAEHFRFVIESSDSAGSPFNYGANFSMNGVFVGAYATTLAGLEKDIAGKLPSKADRLKKAEELRAQLKQLES